LISGFLLVAVFVVSYLLFSNLRYRPLSEDDGNWYYLAKFWKKGIRHYKVYPNPECVYTDYNNTYSSNGYINLHLIIALIYNYLIPGNSRNIATFNYIKIVWFALTSAAIYIFVSLFTHSHITGFISALIYSYVISCTKKNWSDLTYAELFQVLPLVISFIFINIGSTNHIFVFISGIMAAISFQMKITSFPVSFLFAVCYMYNSLNNLLLFSLGFLFLNLLPILIILSCYTYQRKASLTYYTRSIFSPIATIWLMMINKFIPGKKTCIESNYKVGVFSPNAYVYNMQTKNNLVKSRKEILKSLNTQLRQFPIIYLLALFQIAQIFIFPDIFKFFNLLSILLWILIILIQNKSYYPTFNSIWLNIAIMAGMSVFDLLSDTTNISIVTFFAIFFTYELRQWFKNIRYENDKENRKKLAQFPDKKQQVIQQSENVANDIAQVLKEDEKFLVWGNLPNLHIYSDRQSFNWGLFAYPNGILRDFSVYFHLWNAPKIIAYFPPAKETVWNLEKINDAFRVSYEVYKKYDFGVAGRNSYLFKLNEQLYQEILLEQAFESPAFPLTESNTQDKWIRHCLNKIQKINSENFFADYYLVTISKQLDFEQKIKYLKELLQHETNSLQSSQVLYQLGYEYLLMEKYTEAESYLSEALTLNQSDYKIYNSIGELYAHQGDLQNSFLSLQKAHDLNPYSSKVLSNLSVILFQSGDVKNATLCCEKSLAINPGNQEALENRKIILTQTFKTQ